MTVTLMDNLIQDAAMKSIMLYSIVVDTMSILLFLVTCTLSYFLAFRWTDQSLCCGEWRLEKIVYFCVSYAITMVIGILAGLNTVDLIQIFITPNTWFTDYLNRGIK